MPVREGLVISRIDRMRSSANGNPRYSVTFTDGTSAPTGVDASVGYEINNPEYRDVPLRVEFNGRGSIVAVYATPTPVDRASVEYGEGLAALTPHAFGRLPGDPTWQRIGSVVSERDAESGELRSAAAFLLDGGRWVRWRRK